MVREKLGKYLGKKIKFNSVLHMLITTTKDPVILNKIINLWEKNNLFTPLEDNPLFKQEHWAKNI